MGAIEIRGLVKSFGATAVLRDVSIDVADGSFVCLLGPSGCGKSTLLRIVAGLEIADAGSVSIAGRAVDALRPRERDVAMVFQSYALYPYMSVAENMALPLVMRRLGPFERLRLAARLSPRAQRVRREIAAEVEAVAKGLGLDGLLDRRPAQLSGGQRQRVALGRAMVRRPAAFLMDEPLSNLDAQLRAQARAEISALHRALGATFLYVTHDQIEAMSLADKIVVMWEGRVLQQGSPRELYEKPADLTVAEFIGSPTINRLAARIASDGALETLGARLPAEVRSARGEAVTAAFRAEDAALVFGSAAQRPTLAGRVEQLELLGSDLFVHLRLGDSGLVVRARPEAIDRLRVGEAASFTIDPDKLHVFGADGRRLASVAQETAPFVWIGGAA